jgi:hypothetical protein
MANELTTSTKNALGFPTGDGPDPFAKAAKDMGGTHAQFLRFDGNNGDYTYGPDEDKKELDHGDQIACNMATFKRGWICWKNGEVADEIMVEVIAGEPPAASTLKDHGPYQKYDDGTEDGWQEQASVEFRGLENGELFLFKVSSKGARRSMSALLDSFAKVYRQKPNQVPVIEIGATSFEPKVGKGDGPKKKVGKKYAPNLKIVGWIPADEFLALAAQADAATTQDSSGENAPSGEDDPKNYTEQTTTAPAPAPEPEPEAVAEPVAAEERVTPPPAAAGRRAKRF